MDKLLVCVLCTVAHIPSLVLRYLPFSFLVKRTRRNWLFLFYGLALAANFALCMWLLDNQQLTFTFYKINLLLFCVIMAAVNILVIRGYLQEHLFTFGLVAVLVLVMASASAYITDAVRYDTVSQGLILVNLALLGLFAIFYLPLSRLMINTVTPFLNLGNGDYWHSVWAIPIAMFLASLIAVPMNGYTTSAMQLLSKMLICVATIFICRSIAQGYERMNENKLLNEQMEEQRQHYRAISNNMQAEQEARHNFKHHLAVIQNFLHTGNTEELKTYLEQFAPDQLKEIQLPHTGNAAVDGILTHYARVAEDAGIKLEMRCFFPTQGVLDIDLCNLLGNALDNAVTAAKQNGKAAWIKLASEMEGSTLLITVTNSFDGQVITRNHRILSKKRIAQQGIGLQTMQKLCEKYNGVSNFAWEGHEFHADFMLLCENDTSRNE